jgi:hypothetical protein
MRHHIADVGHYDTDVPARVNAPEGCILWHVDTVCGMIRPWMPHYCWASKVGW